MPVVMAGGSGTRFWLRLSRKHKHKQDRCPSWRPTMVRQTV